MRKWQPVLIYGTPPAAAAAAATAVPQVHNPQRRLPWLASRLGRLRGGDLGFQLRTLGRVLLAVLAFVAFDPAVGLLCGLFLWMAHILCDAPKDDAAPRHRLRAL